MSDQTIEVVIKGIDESGPAFESLNTNLGDTRDSFDLLDHSINFATEVLANFVTQALQAVGRAVIDLGSEMIASNAQFEQYATQFSVLLGSLDAAEERMAELAEFGATTPFDLPGVVEADRILQGFGLHAEDVAERFGFTGEEIRRIAGDVAAGTGASFQEMALLIGRFSAGATGEALQRMAELGIGTRDQLRAMGIEFSKSGELMTPLPEAMDAVLTLMEEKYGGMMEAQSHTFEGMLSNLRDWVGQTLREVGQPIFEILSEKLETLLVFLNSGEVKQALSDLAGLFGLAATNLAEWLVPAIEGAIVVIPDLITEINDFFVMLSDFMGSSNPITALGDTLRETFIDTPLGDIGDSLSKLGKKIEQITKPILTWVANNVKLKDGLIALGTTITIALLPVLASLLSSIGPIIAIFAGLVAGVALLRKAWETDFLGIQTTITQVWDETILPAFDMIRKWAGEVLPPLIERFAAVWEEKLKPELEDIWEIVSEQLLPLFGVEMPEALDVLSGMLNGLEVALELVTEGVEFWAEVFTGAAEALQDVIDTVKAFIDWTQRSDQQLRSYSELLRNRVQSALDNLVSFWETRFLPVIEQVWNFIDDHVLPVFRALNDVVRAAGELGSTILAGIWQNLLLPALQAVGDYVQNNIMPVFQSLAFFLSGVLASASQTVMSIWQNNILPAFFVVWSFINDKLLPTFARFGDFVSEAFTSKIDTFRVGVLDPLLRAFGNIDAILDSIARGLTNFATQLRNADEKLPDWLRPDSPPPFEVGLRGVSAALDELSRQKLPALGMALNGLPTQQSQNTSSTQNMYNLNIHTNAPAESALTDFNIMRTLAGNGNAG